MERLLFSLLFFLLKILYLKIMFESFKNFLIINFNFFSKIVVCAQSEFIKTLNDFCLLIDTGTYSVVVKESNIEKIANINILVIPNNFWSILVLEKIILYILLLILILPLIFILFLLILFIHNQIKYQLMGYLTKLEYKNYNFFLFTKEIWRVLWSYAYDTMPRYGYGGIITDIKQSTSLIDFKFPNPKHTLFFFYNLFLNLH